LPLEALPARTETHSLFSLFVFMRVHSWLSFSCPVFDNVILQTSLDGFREDSMRAIVQMMTLIVVAPLLAQSPPAKSMRPDVGSGRAAWFDITTTSLAKSKEFYGKLFDWKFNPVQGTNLAVEIVSGGSSIGDIRVAEGKISSFNGVVYIQVQDIQESCRKAKELGGTLIPGFPFDLSEGRGAIGLVNDPTGHPIGMYSRTPLAPPKPAAK
jgi:predicted enzyme related to lactoylglutathione lyase